jgi:hypothetical protein
VYPGWPTACRWPPRGAECLAGAKLIAAYGERWDPHAVDWGSQGPGNQGTLLAAEKGKREPIIDAWGTLGGELRALLTG